MRRKRGERRYRSSAEIMRKEAHSVDLFRIEKDGWYPLEYRISLLKSMMDVFGWDDKKIEDMGKEGARKSIKMGFLLKYMGNAETVLKSAAKIWSEHYSTGRMELISIEKERQCSGLWTSKIIR